MRESGTLYSFPKGICRALIPSFPTKNHGVIQGIKTPWGTTNPRIGGHIPYTTIIPTLNPKPFQGSFEFGPQRSYPEGCTPNGPPI